MSTRNWARRGEWLELTPGRAILQDQEHVEQWLRETLHVPQHLLRSWKANEGIKIAGDRLRLHVFEPESVGIEAADQPADILYEDDACLVAYKPAGMPVHAASSEQEAERAALANAVACHYVWTGQEVRIRHIHRLDADTTGPVLYAKNALAHAILDEAMREKRIRRTYTAFVHGRVMQMKGVIDAPIGKDRHRSGRRRVSPNGDRAVTHYEVLRAGDRYSLVQLELETGRTHQIRVHMSHIGHPLVGDELYGGETKLLQRQALHGVELCFPHPFSGQAIKVQAPMPPDMAHCCEKI
ncbi:RluA family pseudouridine synthase [Paenibacillus marinisediminis]